MRVLPSRPDHLPKTQSAPTPKGGVGFQCMSFGGTQTFSHSASTHAVHSMSVGCVRSVVRRPTMCWGYNRQRKQAQYLTSWIYKPGENSQIMTQMVVIHKLRKAVKEILRCFKGV